MISSFGFPKQFYHYITNLSLSNFPGDDTTQSNLNNGNYNKVMLCILSSKIMLAHAFTWSKMMKNAFNCSKSYFFHHAYVSVVFNNIKAFSINFDHANTCYQFL